MDGHLSIYLSIYRVELLYLSRHARCPGVPAPRHRAWHGSCRTPICQERVFKECVVEHIHIDMDIYRSICRDTFIYLFRHARCLDVPAPRRHAWHGSCRTPMHQEWRLTRMGEHIYIHLPICICLCTYRDASIDLSIYLPIYLSINQAAQTNRCRDATLDTALVERLYAERRCWKSAWLSIYI